MRERKTTSGFVFSHVITMLFGPIRSETSSRPTVVRHHVNFRVAVVLRSERELFAVAGEAGKRGVARPAGETAGDAAFLADGVEFARVTEHNLLAVGRWETQEPRGIWQRLGRSRAVDYDHEKEREDETKKRC